MHDLRTPHERHLWIFVSSTTETFPWMTACFQPFPLIRPIRTQYCLKALHYFKYPSSILDEFPNAIKWKKTKKQRNVHISEQTKITSFNHFLCPTVGIQKISIYCQQWQRGKKNNKSAHLEAPTGIFFWQSKWKQTTEEPWLKDETKTLFHQLSKQASDRLILHSHSSWLGCLFCTFLCERASVLFAEALLAACSMTAGPERRPSSRRSTLSVWILFSHQKKTEQTHKAASLSVRLPLREDVLASRNGREPQWS